MHGPESQFFENLSRGTLEIQRCTTCHRSIFPPRVFCPACSSGQLEWVPASGKGTIYSWTIVRRGDTEGGDYNVVLVDLAEGPRMMGTIAGHSQGLLEIGAHVSGSVVAGEQGARVVWSLLAGSTVA